jgi:uncharacterized protein YbjT (DUF2867 family)
MISDPETTYRNLTVFGASGAIGGHVVRQALEAGDRVTAVVREHSRFDLSHPALDVVRVPGLTDPEPLRVALKNADAVISGVGPMKPTDTTVASTTVRGILAALESTGVRRFVAVSALPVGPVPPGDSFANRFIQRPIVGTLLRRMYADMSTMEDEIRRSHTDWTIVRPPRLTNKPLSGRYRIAPENVPGAKPISRADVAHAMLAVLDDPATIRRALGVAR